MRAKQFLCINNNRIKSKFWRQLNAFKPLGSLGCCPFQGGGSVVVDLLLYVPPIGCWGSVLVFVFCMHFFMSFLVLQLS